MDIYKNSFIQKEITILLLNANGKKIIVCTKLLLMSIIYITTNFQSIKGSQHLKLLLAQL